MMKETKSNPVSKRNGVKKTSFIEYQSFTNINLTAMPSKGVITGYCFFVGQSLIFLYIYLSIKEKFNGYKIIQFALFKRNPEMP